MVALLLLAVALAAEPATGASHSSASVQAITAPTAATPDLVEITLERQRKDKVESMEAGHVFAKGDVIRLRLNSHYQGYLYVMNQGSSGKFSTVFPASDTGSDNRVMPDMVYLVPADNQGWFQIEGPAGFDILYFLLSPTPLATPAAASFVTPAPAGSLKPRCNDKIFRARGDCTDDSAGPAAVPQGAALPGPLAPIAGEASRDIVFTKKKGDATVAVTGPAAAPMLYTFRLAHR